MTKGSVWIVSGPWCQECTADDDFEDYEIESFGSSHYDIDHEGGSYDMKLACLSSRQETSSLRKISSDHGVRVSSSASVSTLPTKCPFSQNYFVGTRSETIQLDGGSAIRTTPLFRLHGCEDQKDYFSAAWGTYSSDSDSSINSGKVVRFSYPHVSSVKECPSRGVCREERKRMFYTAGDIKRFKRERRQIRFLCRMAGFYLPSDQAPGLAPISIPDSDSDEDEDEVASVSSAASGDFFFYRRQKKKVEVGELCTPFSKILLQDLFLLNGNLFDMTCQ